MKSLQEIGLRDLKRRKVVVHLDGHITYTLPWYWRIWSAVERKFGW